MEPSPHSAAESGPEAIRKNFVAVAAATDCPAPGDGSRLPAVNLSQPISALARTVGMIMHGAPIFRFGEGISTVSEEGRIAPMSAERFTSWVENYLSFTRPTKDAPSVESIGKDLAGKILAADQFQDQLRVLKAVSEVRLPVWNGAGDSLTVDLAPEGFHPDSGRFTVNSIPYEEDMNPDDAWAFLWESLKEFPFDPEGEETIKHRRSFAAQIATMIGVFCHSLFPEGTARPMVIHLANQAGSGKSLLLRMALGPVFGPPQDHGKPESEADIEKLLDMTASARSPYLVLDDCKSLHSHALNRFITSPKHAWRVMYSQREAAIGKVTQLFASGNGLTVSEDLERRSLIVDLFCADDATSRKFSREITLGWLFSVDTRARFLAALWALVRVWREAGMPRIKEHRRGSFEEWSGLVGGVVTACGMANPLQPRQSDSGGDEQTRTLIHVLAAIVGEAERDQEPVLHTGDILDRAEVMGLLDAIVGFTKDSKKALGWRLKKLKGRHLIDSQRRRFEFGRRVMETGSNYPIRFL